MDLHCVTLDLFDVRDVAIRSRHPGIVRALLEGKAHLTADSLHLTADHQGGEVHKCDATVGKGMEWLGAWIGVQK